MHLGTEWKVGSGTHVRFWLDVWSGPCPLSVTFAELFTICNQQEILIAELEQIGMGGLTFRRSFGPIELEQWRQINQIMESLDLNEDPDILNWSLNSNKRFTTKSLYRAITFRWVWDTSMQMIWSCPCPMRMKHFLWLAMRDRIQSCEQLKQKGWDGSESCLLCDVKETTKHILFDCPMASFVWCICRDAFDWGVIPKNFDDFFLLINHMNHKMIRAMTALLAAICWVLWTTRNNMIFRSQLVYSPLTLPYQTISHISQWKALGRAGVPDLLESIAGKLKVVIAGIGGQRTGIGLSPFCFGVLLRVTLFLLIRAVSSLAVSGVAKYYLS